MNHIFLPLFCIFFAIVKRESLEVPTELYENLKIRIVNNICPGSKLSVLSSLNTLAHRSKKSLI